MIVNRDFTRVLLVCILLSFLAGSCKKKRAFNEEDAQSTVDARTVQGQNDEAVKDVNIAIMEQALIRGRAVSETGETGTLGTELCGLSLDTSQVFSGIIKLNYNGTECYGLKRTGSIRVTVQSYPLSKWKHSGCTIKMDFEAYTVTRVSDGKSVRFDGVQYLTNISGNTWFELRYLNASSLVQILTGNDLTVTFDGDNTAVFNFNRRMTYTISNFITSCRVEGLGSHNELSNLENWGETRDGNVFTSQVSSPYVWKTSCGAVAPVEGEVIIKVDTKHFDLKCKFAVDEEGNDVSGDSPCPYGWKVSWSHKKKTNTRVFGYY